VGEQSAGVIAKTVAQRLAGGAHFGYGFIRMCFHNGSPNSSSGVITVGTARPSRLFVFSICLNLFGLAK
jgi:hypothetical protein